MIKNKDDQSKPYLFISACLLGEGCRYDGACRPPISALDELRAHVRLLPICPEVAGGLSTPRLPAERRGERVIRCDGVDVSDAYEQGARLACTLARRMHVSVALLKAKSPSCGKGRIYDGSFTHTLCERQGVTAQRLTDMGVCVYDECELDALLTLLEKNEKDT